MNLRTRDAGHFGGRPNPEVMVFIAVIAILAAIAIPNLINLMESKGRDCLVHLTQGLDGKRGKDAVCPKSDKPYEATPDRQACPAPDKHLESRPEFVRLKGGDWQLRQTLPPYKDQPVELDNGRTVVTRSPGRLSLHVLPARTNRWVFWPFFFLVMVGFLIAGLYLAGKALFTREYKSIAGGLFLIGLFGTVGWFQFRLMASSHEFVFEREGARLTRIDYHLGSVSGKTVYPRGLGVIPTTAVGLRPSKLYVIHDPDATGSRITSLDPIASDRHDIAASNNAAWIGP